PLASDESASELWPPCESADPSPSDEPSLPAESSLLEERRRPRRPPRRPPWSPLSSLVPSAAESSCELSSLASLSSCWSLLSESSDPRLRDRRPRPPRRRRDRERPSPSWSSPSREEPP